jgi:hypothetical protein
MHELMQQPISMSCKTMNSRLGKVGKTCYLENEYELEVFGTCQVVVYACFIFYNTSYFATPK